MAMKKIVCHNIVDVKTGKLGRSIYVKDCFPQKSSPHCKTCNYRKKAAIKLSPKSTPDPKSFKITLNDKFQAVSYIKEYEKEWLKVQSISDDVEYEKSAKQLKARYGIQKLPTPGKYLREEVSIDERIKSAVLRGKKDGVVGLKVELLDGSQHDVNSLSLGREDGMLLPTGNFVDYRIVNKVISPHGKILLSREKAKPIDYDPIEIILPPPPPSNEFSEKPCVPWWEAWNSALARRKLRREHFVSDGKYVQMKVDLTFSIPRLLKSFKEKIKEYRVEEKRRIRKTDILGDGSVDHWAVYKAHHIYNKTLLQITADIFKVKIPKIPTADNDFWPQYQRVEDAYKKAEAMVKSISSK